METTGNAVDPEMEMHLHETRAERARISDARSAALISAHLSFCGQLYRLKPWTAGGCLALFVVAILMASWHWQLLLVFLMLLIPTLGQLLRWWRLHPEYCPLDHVLSSYFHGLFVLGVLAMGSAFVASFVCVILASPLFTIFFLSKKTAIVGELLFALVRWSSFCFVEEIWLLSTLRRFKRRRQHRVGGGDGSARAQRAYALYSSASAVGYATSQCVLLTVIVTAAMEGHSVFETSQEKRGQDSAITLHETLALAGLALFFAWFWLPLRLAASHLNVLELARRPEHPDDPSVCFPLPKDLVQTHHSVSSFSRLALKQRLLHLLDIIKWSWGLRTAHIFQFIFWFEVLAIPLNTVNVVSWLVTTFICWCFIFAVAVFRVRIVEADSMPSGDAALYSTANLRELYGFSLLEDPPADADEDLDYVARPFTSFRKNQRQPPSTTSDGEEQNNDDDDNNQNTNGSAPAPPPNATLV